MYLLLPHYLLLLAAETGRILIRSSPPDFWWGWFVATNIDIAKAYTKPR